MRKLLALILVTLILPSAPPAGAQDAYQEMVVQAGDTLWSISNKYLKDPTKWPEIVKFNNLSAADPTVALPGTKIKIPVTLIKEEFRTAQLIELAPEVRYKRKQETEWKEASKDMTLYYEDSLRTMKDAQAKVRFATRETVQISENSYVVLKPEKLSQEVQLVSGDIRASRAKVIMPQGTVVKPTGAHADYRAKVRKDKSEVVFVYKGNVNVTAQGKTVTVPEGFGTEVLKSAPPTAPIPLSQFPDFKPSDMKVKVVVPAKIEAKMGVVSVKPPSAGPTESASSSGGKSRSVVSKSVLSTYRVQIASDEDFRRVLVEREAAIGTGVDIRKENIPDGTYYMRVAFIDAMGVMGPYSVPNIISRDTHPPVISNLIPADGQIFSGNDRSCDVSGNVDDATSLSVNTDVLFIGTNGRFATTAFLSEGVNTIRVTALDNNGNQTVIDRKVTYKR